MPFLKPNQLEELLSGPVFAKPIVSLADGSLIALAEGDGGDDLQDAPGGSQEI